MLDHEAEHPSRWQAIVSIASKIGCSAHSLNEWLKKAKVDASKRAGVTTDTSAKLKALAPGAHARAINVTLPPGPNPI